MSNTERFREVYKKKLAEAIARHPEEYYYSSPEDIARVVENMIPALAKGSANIEGAVKATARVLGIKPTIGAIKAFLSSE